MVVARSENLVIYETMQNFHTSDHSQQNPLKKGSSLHITVKRLLMFKISFHGVKIVKEKHPTKKPTITPILTFYTYERLIVDTKDY